MTLVQEYRAKSDALLREATRADNLNERGRLIQQAIHFNELALEAERMASAERRGDAEVIPFPQPEAP